MYLLVTSWCWWLRWSSSAVAIKCMCILLCLSSIFDHIHTCTWYIHDTYMKHDVYMLCYYLSFYSIIDCIVLLIVVVLAQLVVVVAVVSICLPFATTVLYILWVKHLYTLCKHLCECVYIYKHCKSYLLTVDNYLVLLLMSTCKQTKLQSYTRHVPKQNKTKQNIWYIYYYYIL